MRINVSALWLGLSACALSLVAYGLWQQFVLPHTGQAQAAPSQARAAPPTSPGLASAGGAISLPVNPFPARPPAALELIANRAHMAASNLASKLSAQILDLECWRTQAREQAQRLGLAALDPLTREFRAGSDSIELQLTLVELILQLTPLACDYGLDLSPALQAQLEQILAERESQPRLAVLAARTQVALGGNAALANWTNGLIQDTDPTLSELAMHAFAGLHSPAIVEELARALSLQRTDDALRRIVQLLRQLTVNGTQLWYQKDLAHSVCQGLSALAEDAQVDPSLREEARATADRWRR